MDLRSRWLSMRLEIVLFGSCHPVTEMFVLLAERRINSKSLFAAQPVQDDLLEASASH